MLELFQFLISDFGISGWAPVGVAAGTIGSLLQVYSCVPVASSFGWSELLR